MYEYERINHEINDYYSFALSILNFLQKNLIQFSKALKIYSQNLKHFHIKSTNLLIKNPSNYDLSKHLYHAFLSFIQTFNDEYHQLEQRARFLKIIHLNIFKLKQDIHSSIFSKQRQKLHNYTYRIIRLNRKKKRQYLYKLIQQIRKHDKLTLICKDNLDNITSQTTNLLWKLFSYSPYKFDIKSSQTLLINNDLPGIKNESSIEFGSGDQIHSKLIKENIEQEQQQISNSNNALIGSITSKKTNHDENRSIYSTDIDETIVEKNRLYDNIIDEDDDRWLNIVKHNEIQLKQTTLSISTDQSSDDSESIIKQHKRIIKTKNSLHLSDISYTTDYYSQNESD